MLRSQRSSPMVEAPGSFGARVAPRPQPLRLLSVFAAWRLEAYGYTLAAFYVVLFVYLCMAGSWILDGDSVPIYNNFTNMWVAGNQALHEQAAAAYDPIEHLRAEDALVGAGRARFSVWPYPPIYFLILAPLGMLPYLAGFLTWVLVTLLSYVAILYSIVPRRPVIALSLASPFVVWNTLAGQSGFLTASLLGGSLLLLERRPVLAGVFIGCLAYKPQWGIMLPVALVAAGQWRALASSAAAVALLVALSIAVFGTADWEAFPRELLGQAGINFSDNPDIASLRFDPRGQWQYHQTIFGLIRALHGAAPLAWIMQGVTTMGAAVIVYAVWRSRVRYALKAATLSAAAFVATPYAFAYDMAAIAIPVAFLANEQIQFGLLKNEQPVLLLLFGASLCCNLESLPLEPVVVIALLCLILRRVFFDCTHARVCA